MLAVFVCSSLPRRDSRTRTVFRVGLFPYLFGATALQTVLAGTRLVVSLVGMPGTAFATLTRPVRLRLLSHRHSISAVVASAPHSRPSAHPRSLLFAGTSPDSVDFFVRHGVVKALCLDRTSSADAFRCRHALCFFWPTHVVVKVEQVCVHTSARAFQLPRQSVRVLVFDGKH